MPIAVCDERIPTTSPPTPISGRSAAACDRRGPQEQNEATADAAEQFRRNQSLRDWLTAAMHAGDRIAVTIVDQRFTGTVEEVGDDLLALRAMFGRVDIHLAAGIPLQIELEDHPTSGGQRGRTDVRVRRGDRHT